MNICFLTEEYPNVNDFGGIGFHFSRLVAGLSTSGHQLTVIYNGDKAFSSPNVEVIPVSSLLGTVGRKIYRFFSRTELGTVLCWSVLAVILARRLDRQHRFEVIETHDYHCVPWWLLLGKERLVFTLQGGKKQTAELNQEFRKLSHQILFFLEKLTLDHAVHLYASSPVQKLAAMQMYQTNIETCIPNAVDTSFFHPASKASPRKTEFILFAGRVETRKGILPLLEGYRDFALARKKQTTPDLIIIGNDLYHLGPHRDESVENYLATQFPDHLAPKVVHLPRIKQAKLRLYYQAASCCIFPSLSEPFGNVIAEALSCGQIVITGTEIGATSYLTDKQSFFSIPVERKAIRQAFEHVFDQLTSSQKSTLKQQARTLAVKHFSVAEVTRLTEKYYQTIIDSQHYDLS